MAMVLQGRDSAYETDLFAPIVSAVQSGFAGTRAGQRDIRIVADHIRASTFILSEGVVPSNEGRGYIPRRLLRKAIATATQAGAADFDLGNVASVVIDHMRHTYPQLAVGRDRTLDLMAREQRDFGRVVRRGLDRPAPPASRPPPAGRRGGAVPPPPPPRPPLGPRPALPPPPGRPAGQP